MSRRRLRRSVAALVTASILSMMLALPTSAATITTVATGLDSPRGMTFGPNGALYVAEAGEGGDDYSYTHPAFGLLSGGASGAVTRIWKGKQTRVVSGLPSISGPEGANALGPEDVSAHGNGNLMIPMGFGGPPEEIAGLGPEAFPLGWLIKANPSGRWKAIADISGYELANDPDAGLPGTHVDSNPKAAMTRGGGAVVADAGGNDLLWVTKNGRTSLLAVFEPVFVPFPGVPDPGIPMQPVPDSIALGPDGAYYVGLLTGFPFAPGMAQVMRVTADGDVSVYADGFTNIIDVAFGPDGSLYVLEIATNGLLSGDPTGGLWRVPAGGGAAEPLLTAPLFLPGGMAIARDGSIYISTCAPCPNAGEVLRIQL